MSLLFWMLLFHFSLTTVGVGEQKINAPTQTNAATRNTHYQRQRHSATINEMKYYLCSEGVVFWALKFHIFQQLILPLPSLSLLIPTRLSLGISPPSHMHSPKTFSSSNFPESNTTPRTPLAFTIPSISLLPSVKKHWISLFPVWKPIPPTVTAQN